jgi:uncharacterized protein (TIGR03790 family)
MPKQFCNIPARQRSKAMRMMKIFVRFAILLLAFAPGFAWLARAGGDEVVVIYNKKMPGSKDVAEYYAQARNVPQSQVVGFSLPTSEGMTRDQFSQLLQNPLARKLEDAGLWTFGETTLQGADGKTVPFVRGVVASKIRYAVLCFGVPLRILPDADVHEPEHADVPAIFQNNGASVDSELAWLPLIENKERLSGPMMNRLYCTTNAALLDPTNGILLVTRLDGPSAAIAIGLVKKSLEGEQEGLWGRSYFDTRSITDPHYMIGDKWMLESAELFRQLGFEPTVDKNPGTFPADFPMSHIAIYAGWYSGDADGPFAQPTVEFMPGAFAYHLHSYSAATLRSTNQNWCGPLLAKGATCTMGCVDEPSIQFTPNVAVFFARWTINHFTYGQAAWSAQPALSWQTTIVGDPLYCPFSKSQEETYNELSQSHSPLLQWFYWRMCNAAQAKGAPLSKLEVFLENLPITDTSAVLTEKLAELCDAQGKPESAIDFYQRALNLDPSPEQRIRIRLTLGQDLVAQNEIDDAIENYKELLEESPAYPGRDTISIKIAALEQKASGAK